MTMTPEDNREAAREQAERKGFDPAKVLYCTQCGRTVVRRERGGRNDKVFCTCKEAGYQMARAVPDRDGDADE